MWEIGVVAEFEAAHRLVGDFGPATRRHGHTYRVEVVARGGGLSADGTLADIGALQDAAHEATRALHYRDLDELPAFAGRNTTAEVVAKHLFDEIAGRCGSDLKSRGVTMLGVRVWESPRAWAGYEAKLE